MREQVQTKAVVTVSHMARMVGLSRARFYQLVEAGVFPTPVYFVANRRPFFDEDMQKVCLEVRRRNCGINGKPVLFYSNGHQSQLSAARVKRPTKPAKPKADHADIIEGLAALGLNPTAQQVQSAVQTLYPSGTNHHERGDVLRSIFLHLKRQNTPDNVGR
jgi:hypothetical protein